MYDDQNDYESNADRAVRERLEELQAENDRLRAGQQAPPDPMAALNAELADIPEFVKGGEFGHMIVNPDAPRLIGEAIRKHGGSIVPGPHAHRYGAAS